MAQQTQQLAYEDDDEPQCVAEILVCQAGSCRAAGSEAVLLEIEALAEGLGCIVEPSGCVGACSKAPNAIILDDSGQESLHTRLDTLEKSVEVVTKATGRAPNLDDPGKRPYFTSTVSAVLLLARCWQCCVAGASIR